MANFLARLTVFVRRLYATPEDQEDAYLWALVLIGHRAIGEVATGLLLDFGLPTVPSVLVPAALYAFAWELGQVRAGGGVKDGAVDFLAQWSGCVAAAAAAGGERLWHLGAVCAFLVLLVKGMSRRV